MRPPSALQPLLDHPILSSEEERALLVRAVDGDQRAIDSLVRHNGRLVWSVVARYGRYGVDAEDLWQEGVIGVLIAIRKFDLGRQVRFATYAVEWIRNQVGRYAQDHCSDIRWPSRSQHRKALIESGEGEQVSETWRAEIARAATVVASIDQPGLSDRVAIDRGHSRIEAEFDVASLLGEGCLDARDRAVLVGRLRGESHGEIGHELGLPAELVRQREDQAIMRLRRWLCGESVEPCDDAWPFAFAVPGEQLALPLSSEAAA